MFSGITSRTLSSSSHLLTATWESALLHFRRALLECGSPLEVEHSQRLGLLFSRNVGATAELKQWASLFDAEDVPSTALLLKALVNHDQWHTAIKLFELNKDRPFAPELAEVFGQGLVGRGLWQQTLQLASLLTERPLDANSASTSTELQISKSTLSSTESSDDSQQMAENPAFLPAEERTTYCSFVSAVARAFPLRQQWKEAVDCARSLQKVVDARTKKRLVEYEVARLVHDGERYNEVIERSQHQRCFRASPSLQRSLLRCAITAGQHNLVLDCLELLSALGSATTSVRLFESACTFLLSSEETWSKSALLRFESLVCLQGALVQDRGLQKLIRVFCADYDLKLPVFLSAQQTQKGATGELTDTAAATSITNLDRLASTLAAQSRWKEALQVAERIRASVALDDNERVIFDMLQASAHSWERTLQFFTP